MLVLVNERTGEIEATFDMWNTDYIKAAKDFCYRNNLVKVGEDHGPLDVVWFVSETYC